MDSLLALVVPAALLGVVIYILLTPIKLGWKLLIHGLCGFLCLWLLNWISPFTGIVFAINPITVLVAGFLGVPGVLALALAQIFL